MAEVNTFYRAKRAAALGNAVAEAMFTRADPGAAGQAVFTNIPSSGKLNGQGFSIIARGTVIAGAAGAVTINFRAGNTLAAPLLASFSVTPGAAGNLSFDLRCNLIWDTVAQTIRGDMQGVIGGLIVNRVISSNNILGFDPNANVDIPVICTGTFAVSNAANDMRLNELISALN